MAWVSPEEEKRLALCKAQNNTSKWVWLLFVESLLCARHLSEFSAGSISFIHPSHPMRLCGDGHYPTGQVETRSLTAEPLHPVHWRSSVWVSLEMKLRPLGWPPKYLLTLRFYDSCGTGIKIRKQNLQEQRRKREYEWMSKGGLQSLLQIISSVFLLYFSAWLGHRFAAFV